MNAKDEQIIQEISKSELLGVLTLFSKIASESKANNTGVGFKAKKKKNKAPDVCPAYLRSRGGLTNHERVVLGRKKETSTLEVVDVR